MPDGQVQRGGYNTDWMRGPEESDFLLVTPGKSLTFFPASALSLRKREPTFPFLSTNGYGGSLPF
ncbi:MAG: hypothetical protein U7126_07295 [Microcoleus sp.]